MRRPTGAVRTGPDADVDRDRCADRDAGAGSVLVLALVAVALVAAGAVASVGQVEAARARTQTAADLAALAGASRLVATGRTGESCTLAEHVSARNRATVSSCTMVRPQVLEVRVTGRTPFGDATAVARAGPSSEREP
ncbi:MAG: histidine kinase [Actinobacteria bacterium]|nr:histidine kinase [Actinomycetota bacterium]